MSKPRSDFRYYKSKTGKVLYQGEVVWASVIDCRYGVEIVRQSEYTGKLCVFDLDSTSKLICCEDIHIPYDNHLGFTQDDTDYWEKFVNNLIRQ